MRLGIAVSIALAAASGATLADDIPRRVSVIVNPDWLKKPTPDQITAAWPRAALIQGKGGRAEVDCRVNIQGLAEDCRVASEEPAGFDFGAAALSMTPQWQFRPATRDGKPFPSRIVVPIKFETNSPTSSAQLLEVTFLSRPVWKAAPTFAEVGAVYPRGGAGVAGYVAYRCHVKSDGDLHFCNIIDENPKARGFAGAAHGLLKAFQIDMATVHAKDTDKLLVDVPIRLIDPASEEFKDRRIGEPIWVARVDPARSANLFPAQAAKAGVHSGRGVVSCVVAADGALVDCAPEAAVPPGLGFSEMAVRVVGVMRMNRWTNAGGPIDGARIVIPVRLTEPAPGISGAPPS
jgi:TonB family protein